jgi:formylglycine-generating enzyme required for sulfatase activity
MYCPNCKQHFDSGKFCPDCEGPNGEAIRLVNDPAPAAGVSLGDAAAISGGLHVSDSHAVHNEDRSVHNISNTTSNVTNITQVSAQKTEFELIQERKTQFLNACKRAYEDNVLEQREVAELEELRIKIGLDKTTADNILESIRVMSDRNARKSELNPIAKTKLKILTDNLQKNEVKALMDQIDSLEPLVRRFDHDELSRKYYLVLSALKPERCIEQKERTQTDTYWEAFWSYLAYIKAGRLIDAEETLASLDHFSSYPEDNMTVLAAAGALMMGHTDEAKEYLDAAMGEYTPALQRFVDSIYLLLNPDMAKEMGADGNNCAFYLVNFFGQKDPKAKVEEAAGAGINLISEVKERGQIVTQKIAEKQEIENIRHENNTIIANGVSFTMIAVKGGSFQMGATSEQGSDARREEKPPHRVSLSDYYIGETEVTQALWQAVMGTNPSYNKGSNLPVEKVSWDICQQFITRLNQLTGRHFRLPTEAEWEYAARGGYKSQGYRYSGSNTLSSVGWFADNSGSRLDGNINQKSHPVKKKRANELGIYDMSGNVWEWCQDWYDGEYYGKSPSNDPCNNELGSYRVNRGGSWDFSQNSCRVARRGYNRPDSTSNGLGLRLAL